MLMSHWEILHLNCSSTLNFLKYTLYELTIVTIQMYINNECAVPVTEEIFDLAAHWFIHGGEWEKSPCLLSNSLFSDPTCPIIS